MTALQERNGAAKNPIEARTRYLFNKRNPQRRNRRTSSASNKSDLEIASRNAGVTGVGILSVPGSKRDVRDDDGAARGEDFQASLFFKL